MSHNTRDYARLIRARGGRVTPQRRLVLDAVCEGGRHSTLEEIHTRLQVKDPGISLSTLYRALDFLISVGLVAASERADGKALYEIAGVEPHHHLVCRECGRETQIDHAEFARFFERIESASGFRPDASHLTLSGLCPACQQEKHAA